MEGAQRSWHMDKVQSDWRPRCWWSRKWLQFPQHTQMLLGSLHTSKNGRGEEGGWSVKLVDWPNKKMPRSNKSNQYLSFLYINITETDPHLTGSVFTSSMCLWREIYVGRYASYLNKLDLQLSSYIQPDWCCWDVKCSLCITKIKICKLSVLVMST